MSVILCFWEGRTVRGVPLWSLHPSYRHTGSKMTELYGKVKGMEGRYSTGRSRRTGAKPKRQGVNVEAESGLCSAWDLHTHMRVQVFKCRIFFDFFKNTIFGRDTDSYSESSKSKVHAYACAFRLTRERRSVRWDL